MQLPPTQSSREVRSQCRSTVCRSCTWANLRQIAHSYWLRFGVYHKITDISIKTNIKTTVHIIWKTHTGHKSLRFPTPNICRFGTLWCNRNHPSSKAWLSHPGATMELTRTSGEKLCDRFSLDLSKDTIIHQSGLHTKQQHMPKDQYFTQSIPMQWMQDDAGCMLQIHSSLAAGRHQHSVLRKVHAWELWPSVTTRSDSDAFSKRHQRYWYFWYVMCNWCVLTTDIYDLALPAANLDHLKPASCSWGSGDGHLMSLDKF